MNSCLPSLGSGIYQISDVARYTRMHYNTVRSWFFTRGLLQSEYKRVHNELAVSFHDLIDTLVASHFRKHGVKMRIVRRAFNRLSETLGTQHPFCHRNLYTDGKTIIVDTAQKIGEISLQDAISNQRFFDQIKEQLVDVSYSTLTALAARWNIAPSIVIDPHLAMGYPVINGTGITTFVIQRSYRANNNDSVFVAQLFGLSVKQVEDAVQFEDCYKTAA